MRLHKFISVMLVFVLLVSVSNCLYAYADTGVYDAPLVEDGVYYISNKKSGNQLTVQDFSIAENANAVHIALDMEIDYLYSWKIEYLGYGFYSIRPIYKLDMALTAVGDDVVIQNVGTTDTFDYISQLNPYALWTIEEDEYGLVFKNVGVSERALYIERPTKETYPDALLAEYEADIPHCHWELEKVEDLPTGALLYKDGIPVYTCHFYVLKGETIELSSAGVVPAAYSSDTISQEFSWTSSAPNVISVDAETGTFTVLANAPEEDYYGYKTITGVSVSGDTVHFSVQVMRAVILGSQGVFSNPGIGVVLGNQLQAVWNEIGYNTKFVQVVDGDLVRQDISGAEMVYIIGHGSQHNVSINSGAILADSTSNGIPIANLPFSSTKLCVVNACFAALTYDGSNNVCREIYYAGADCVLGWASLLYADDAVVWQERFQRKLQEGYTVEMAVRYANSFLYSAYLPVYCNSCENLIAIGQKDGRDCSSCDAIWNTPQYLDYSDIKNNRIYGNCDFVISAEPAVSIDFGETYVDFEALGIEFECTYAPNGHGNHHDVFDMVMAYFDRSENISMFQIVYTLTGEGNDDFVLDFIYKQFGNGMGDYRGQVYGYTVIVENNRIVGIRDNRYPMETTLEV